MSRPPVEKRFKGSSYKDLFKHLDKMGVKVTYTGSGHMAAHCPLGKVIIAVSASEYRSLRNTVSELRRKGLAL